MSTSARQITANRQNAKHSTGPRTPEGKAVSSRNALKHGLFARQIILASRHHSEDPAEFERLLESLRDELKPKSLFQEHLVRKISHCLWRSQRAVIAETAHINHQLEDIDRIMAINANTGSIFDRFLGRDPETQEPQEIESEIAYRVGQSLIPDRKTAHNILWYEMRLDRQLSRAFFMLNLLQRPTSVAKHSADNATHPTDLNPRSTDSANRSSDLAHRTTDSAGRPILDSETVTEIRPELAIFEIK